MSGKHHWVGEVDPATCYGFVYLITNTVTDRKYIGRKFYHTYKRKRRVKESNWREYAGSCRPLQEDMQRLGKDKFTFEIICNYKTRGGVVSGEVHFQTDNDVLSPELLPCGERLYYNGQIGNVKFITPEFHSAESRAKMSAANKGEKNSFYGKSHSVETRAKLSADKMGEKNPNYGKPHSAEVRAKMSAANKGEKNPFYGKAHSAEARAKIGAANKGEKHPFYGKAHSAAAKAKISASLSKGPYLISFKDGHTEEWEVLSNQDRYAPSALYRVLYGKRNTHKDIVKVERIGSDDR